MSSGPSSRPSEERHSSAGYLPRGGACVSCRRRKMKCDGKRPVCTQCDRAGRAEDCEYTSGQERSTVQILEEHISRLETRIQELQNPELASTSVTLHQPYGAEHSSTSESTPPSNARLVVQDPPRPIAEALLAVFFEYATDIGFFLNIPRFQAMMMQGYAPGHPARPAPALIFSIYLWAIRLSTDPTVKSREGAYLQRAIQDAATALSSTHPKRVLHSIQAEVLLATYFFANGRFFEGKYHVANAVSTMMSARMHKIRSAVPGGQTSTSNPMPAPRDSLEEGEHIIGAWTVLNLDGMWATVLSHSPEFEDSTHAMGTKVDTPWPMEMEEFEQGLLPPQVRTANTIRTFLSAAPTLDLGLSSWAFESKAVILFYKASIFERKCSSNPAQLNFPNIIQEFTSLTALVENVIGQLPSPAQQMVAHMPSAERVRRLIVGYTLLKMATITLHAPFAVSGRSEISIQTRVSAARDILEIIIALRRRGTGYLNPIVGAAWVEAGQILFDEVTTSRAQRAAGAYSRTDERGILELIQTAISAMLDYGTNIPLTSFQVGKIQETYQALTAA